MGTTANLDLDRLRVPLSAGQPLPASAPPKRSPQTRRCRHDRRGHFGGAADDQRVGVDEIARQLVRRAAAAGVDGPSWYASKKLDSGGRKLIGNNDVHGSVARLQWLAAERAPCRASRFLFRDLARGASSPPRETSVEGRVSV